MHSKLLASRTKINIYEMAIRDGIQSLSNIETIGIAHRVKFIRHMQKAGVKRIEIGSIVNKKCVPQMACTGELIGILKDTSFPKDTRLGVLVPNLRAMEQGLHYGMAASPIFEAAVFVSATEAFSQKNTKRSILESLKASHEVVQLAHRYHIPVRGYVSAIAEDPITQEATSVKDVANVVRFLREMGVYEISLGDTTGKCTPSHLQNILSHADVPSHMIAGHFHDTYGKAIDNIRTAITHGVTVFDSSAGGIGGCPYAPGASGNVDTKAIFALGYDTGIDTQAYQLAADAFCQLVPPSVKLAQQKIERASSHLSLPNGLT